MIHCKYDDLVDPKKLKPHPKNRNKHSADQIQRLAELYQYHGVRHPIIVSKLSGCIVAGHGRKDAAIKAGLKEFPVVYQEFENEQKEYAFIQADNAIALWSELDIAGISLDVQSFGDDFDQAMLGIKNFDLNIDQVEGQCDEDEVPEEPKEPVTALGDIYELGNHRLMCGDSTLNNDFEKLMNGETADMVWTDPPYNVAYEGKTKDALKIKNDSMNDESFYSFLFDVYTNLLIHTKEGGAIYVAHADSEGANFRNAMKKSGWLLKQCLILVKQTLVMGRQDYHWKHEPILYGWKSGASHNWYSDRKQSTVLEFNKPNRNAEHPTMKPVELVEYMIKNSCKNGGIVLDAFGGSGTTLIACEKNGMKSALLELDPKYCDVIVSRYCKFTGKNKIKRNGQEIEWQI